jgi:hypothetical protein
MDMLLGVHSLKGTCTLLLLEGESVGLGHSYWR